VFYNIIPGQGTILSLIFTGHIVTVDLMTPMEIAAVHPVVQTIDLTLGIGT
jgi:hypothetical protein